MSDILFSPLTLAYMGDAVYEIYVRRHLLERGNRSAHYMHLDAKKYVTAAAQSMAFSFIEPMLTEEEISVYKRGRNAKSTTTPKHANLLDYRRASGLEALFGYLYMKDDIKRVEELMNLILNHSQPR